MALGTDYVTYLCGKFYTHTHKNHILLISNEKNSEKSKEPSYQIILNYAIQGCGQTSQSNSCSSKMGDSFRDSSLLKLMDFLTRSTA